MRLAIIDTCVIIMNYHSILYNKVYYHLSLECSVEFVLKPSMISVSESSAPNLGRDQAIINEYRENNYTWCANVSSRKPRIQVLYFMVPVLTRHKTVYNVTLTDI